MKIFGGYNLNLDDRVEEVFEGKLSDYNPEAKVGPREVGLKIGRVAYAVARGNKVPIEEILDGDIKMPSNGARVTHQYSPMGKIYRLMRDIMENPEKYKQK